ncbi:hypothetical protein CHS0354_024869 [Potamilus streckersoni]|uniref:Solute carrier organic anion transporter family member n=1 Tax=Potamilus streckersoni TaxID=2493646 RepID=A0AAE0TFB6_9BIVA|nr:hypothetical protein CHS0354_024869 [Potamilus streckersoni]
MWPYYMQVDIYSTKRTTEIRIKKRITETEYGIGNCKPKYLQCCANICTMVGVYCLSGLFTSVLRTYIEYQISNIKKQFGFADSHINLILRMNDVGFLLSVLFAGFIAQTVHIPRMLTASIVLYGVGGIIFSVPYFSSKDSFISLQDEVMSKDTSDFSFYWNPVSEMQSSHRAPLCSSKQTAPENCSAVNQQYDGYTSSQTDILPMILMLGGVLLQGLGQAPRYPLVATFIDDNVNKRHTPMYLGIVTGIALLGPALAAIISGVLSKIDVVIDRICFHMQHLPRIGSWLLGFFLIGVASVFSGIPLMFFPRWTKVGAVRKSRLTLGKGTKEIKSTCKRCRSVFTGLLRRIAVNPLFWLLTVAACLHFLVASTSEASSAKYLEIAFSMHARKAVGLQKAISVLSLVFGTVIGGVIISRTRLHPVTCTKLVIVVSVITTVLGTSSLFLRCSIPEIEGFTANGTIKMVNSPQDQNNDSSITCKETCYCDMMDYFPVCGSDGRNYFSPCIAGCTTRKEKIFANCSCIEGKRTATPALCEPDCYKIIPYLVATALTDLSSGFYYMPAFFVFLRCVKDRDKSFAVALAAFFIMLLGWIPGPIISGKLLDSSCRLWKSTSGSTGTCSLYDVDHFSHIKTGFESGFRIAFVTFNVIIFLIARKKRDWSFEDEVDSVLPFQQEESVELMEESEMATTPTGWNSDPIYMGFNTPKRLGSFNKR